MTRIFYANNLPVFTINTALRMPALNNLTAIPRCSFDNLAILCFPNVWIHIM